jgi:hypothetical protein
MARNFCVGLVSERMQEVMRVHQALAGRLNFISGPVEWTADEKKKAKWRSCSKASSVAESED